MNAEEIVTQFGSLIWERLYKEREILRSEQVQVIEALFRASALGDPEVDYDTMQMVKIVLDDPYAIGPLLDEMKSASDKYNEINEYYSGIYYDMRACGAIL